MDATQEQLVRNIAYNSDHSLAQSNAQAILRLVYGEEFEFVPELPTGGAKMAMPEGNKGIREISDKWDEKAATGFLGDNIPNPFSRETLIPYYLPEGTEGKMMLYDITGKKIREYLLFPGNNLLSVSLEEMSEGIYFYSLSLDGMKVNTKKMVLIR